MGRRRISAQNQLVVWPIRPFGEGSVSKDAVEAAPEKGIAIEGSCPKSSLETGGSGTSVRSAADHS